MLFDRLALGQRLRQFFEVPRFAAEHVERAIARDTHDPARKIARFEKFGRAPNLQKDRLRDILGACRVPKHTKSYTVHQAVISVVKSFEGSGVALTHPRHEPASIFHCMVFRLIGSVPRVCNEPGGTMDGVARRLAGARSVFVLTGAGMSAESGLPTFRGAGGLWQQHRVEELASPQGFAKDPRLVWRWYNERLRAHRRAEPNAGHRALAELENCTADFTLATQNVDSLHVRAGSRGVLELHGHLREARCTKCSATFPLDDGLPENALDHACGGRFRPQVVWFGEALPQAIWERAAFAATRADVVLVVGTSAQVYPAASLAFANDAAFVVEINPEPSAISDRVDVTIRETAAAALPRIVASIREPDR